MVNKLRLYWTLQVGGWFVYALVQIVFSIVASDTVSAKRVSFLLLEAFLCLIITHLFRLLIKKRKWLNFSLPRLIPNVLFAVIFMSLVLYFLRLPVNIFLGRLFEIQDAFIPTNILGQSSFYTIVFFLWTVFYVSYHYFERYNTSLKYEAYMTEIELRNLKSQLNPHFIFNAMNSIRALVDENPEKAKSAINQLSNILRNSLAADKKGLTNFHEELKIVKDYLGLESIRFEERLKTEFDIDPLSLSFPVPPLMIQTLVENGIKHGISKLTKGGTIQVKTIVEHGKLKVQIRNSGQLINGSTHRHEGLGLKNTIQRLKLLYGNEALFHIRNESKNAVLTEVIVPQNTSHESINR